MTNTLFQNSVSQAYARDGKGIAVYGRYREAGYKVEPLVDKVGTRITENVSGTEAFQIAGLDWSVEKQPAFKFVEGEYLLDPDYQYIRRSDTNHDFQLVSKRYEPIQHTVIADLFNYLSGEIEIENVLSIRNGAKCYATASIKVEDEVVPGDRVRRYLHAFNSHDGSSCFGVFFTDVRLACANQLSRLVKREARLAAPEHGFRRRHVGKVEEFSRDLPQLINMERQSFYTSISELRDLTGIPLTDELTRRILETTYAEKLSKDITDRQTGKTRTRILTDLSEFSTIRSHLSGSTGLGMDMEGVQGTVYGLFNAITQCETHDGGRGQGRERNQARLESLYNGNAAKRINITRDACLALV